MIQIVDKIELMILTGYTDAQASKLIRKAKQKLLQDCLLYTSLSFSISNRIFDRINNKPLYTIFNKSHNLRISGFVTDLTFFMNKKKSSLNKFLQYFSSCLLYTSLKTIPNTGLGRNCGNDFCSVFVYSHDVGVLWH